jgi:serine phosphatase RsbU (regulator of sigma subunit)
MEEVHTRHLPVIEGGRLVGIVSSRFLIAHRAEHLGRVVAERTEELQALTDQLLQRERQATRNLKLAGRLQTRLLLPSAPPAWPEVQWGVHFAPLDYLGGDYYDFAQPDGRHLGVLIADASGHSLPAAMVAVATRIAFAEVTRTHVRPAAVLAAMNRRLLGLADERFVTAFYGVIDRVNGCFSYANAGHPNPLHYDAKSGQCRPLNATGFMLGLWPDAKYEEGSVCLGPGDRLAFYTDGVTDTRGATDDPYGTERLEAALAGPGGAAAVVKAAVAAVTEYRGERRPADDVTLLVAELRP